jgi:phosphatidate cytidylyltransferase
VATLLLAEAVLVLAFVEYAGIAEQLGARVPRAVAGLATATACAALGWPGASLEVAIMASSLAVCVLALSSDRRGPDALYDVAASLFPVFYLGLPLGALAAIRAQHGREALLLLLATVIVSDTAQYYGGSLMGRRALSPRISPKKTIEGALFGLLAGVLVVPGIGRWWLAGRSPAVLALLGATLVPLGICGDLFESLLKRSAGVKDSSTLIPGHGGMLDRVDSLLFTAPVYYVFLRYTT